MNLYLYAASWIVLLVCLLPLLPGFTFRGDALVWDWRLWVENWRITPAAVRALAATI